MRERDCKDVCMYVCMYVFNGTYQQLNSDISYICFRRAALHVRRLLLHELEFHFQEVEVHHLDHTTTHTLHMHFIIFFLTASSITYHSSMQ